MVNLGQNENFTLASLSTADNLRRRKSGAKMGHPVQGGVSFLGAPDNGEIEGKRERAFRYTSETPRPKLRKDALNLATTIDGVGTCA